MVVLQLSLDFSTNVDNNLNSFDRFHSMLRHDAKTHAVKMRIVLSIRMEESIADADPVLDEKTNIQMPFAQVC